MKFKQSFSAALMAAAALLALTASHVIPAQAGEAHGVSSMDPTLGLLTQKQTFEDRT